MINHYYYKDKQFAQIKFSPNGLFLATSINASAIYLWGINYNPPMFINTQIVGINYVCDQNTLLKLTKNQHLNLEREPFYKQDSNAIAVVNTMNKKIGYLPEKDALELSKYIDAGEWYFGTIQNIYTQHGEVNRIDMRIELFDSKTRKNHDSSGYDNAQNSQYYGESYDDYENYLDSLDDNLFQ